MPFSIAAQPSTPALSGNQLIYRIACADGDGNPFAWRGIRSRMFIEEETSYYSDGDTITIAFQEPDFGPSHSIVFTCRDTPTTSTEFPSDTMDFGSLLEYWQEVASILQAHPSIAPHLIVYVEDLSPGYYIWAESKTYETGWTVTITTIVSIPVTNYSSLLSTIPINYRLYADVWVESSFRGTPVRRARLEGIPNRNSEVRFDVAGIVHAGIEATFPNNFPAFTANTPQVWDIMRGYYLRFWENIGEASATYDGYTVSDGRLALCGGIANSLFPGLDFFSSISAANSLLTWRPNRRTVGIEQPEWLSWYNYTPNPVSPAIQVTYYYPDGTNFQNVLQTEHGILIESTQVALVPVGFQVLDGVARITAVKYSVQVGSYADDTFTPLSPIITYFVDYAYRLNTKYLMYLNGFCTLEVLRCFGDTDTDLEVDRELYDSTLQPGYSANTRQRGQHAQDWDNAYTYHTGYITKQEAEVLQELFIYGKVWELTAAAIIPLLHQGKKFAITSTRQSLHAYAIEMIKSISERWFVPSGATSALAGGLLVDDEGDPLIDDEGDGLTEG